MSETKEVAVQTPVEVANSVECIPAIQGQLAEWSRAKLVEAKMEEAELRAAYTEAKAHKWKSSAILGAANKALVRVEYYEKVIAALDAGYMLFPPIDNLSVIAIRTEEEYHKTGDVTTAMHQQPGAWGDSKAGELPVGSGAWKSPRVRWWRAGITKQPDGSERQEWTPAGGGKLENPEFPLVMARVSCVEATSVAMEGRFFDEVAIYPKRARKDPVIIGRIRDPIRSRWLHFLISWRVDKRDL
jgi:hypothetical protein